MAHLCISDDRRHFTKDGKLFFWIGDTVWSAFTNPTIEEWQEYLSYRKRQGFNVLQINTLPQWDRCTPDQGIYPYPVREDGSMDHGADVDQRYTEHVLEISRMAVKEGFQLALVVDWANFIPGTWLTKMFPTHAWPLAAIEKHVCWVTATFAEFQPVYIVSGDTDYRTDEPIVYYRRTIELLKQRDPSALLTMHMTAGNTDIPDGLADMLDFYMYQSGHFANMTDTLETIPKAFRDKYPLKPLLNGEPCYENMPKMTGNRDVPPTEFFNGEEVYEASRRSILAGADAGITYGANGLWNWNRNSSDAESQAGSMYAKPIHWHEAMCLPGAGKIASLKELIK